MSDTYPAQTLLLDGPDALAFAQAQLSGRVDDVPVGQWRFNAWLDAKGRVLAFVQLIRVADETLLLLLRGGDAETIAQGLKRYVFRSKLHIQAQAVQAISTGPAMPLHSYAPREKGFVLGCDTHSMVIGSAHDDAWRALQIEQGWPWLVQDTLGQYLPPMLSLERLNAVAFDKGCYPGQEIVARLHYRGGNKRHLCRVVLSRPLPAGSVLRTGEHEAMRLLDVAHDARYEALAVVADNVHEAVHDAALQHDNEAIDVMIAERWTA